MDFFADKDYTPDFQEWCINHGGLPNDDLEVLRGALRVQRLLNEISGTEHGAKGLTDDIIEADKMCCLLLKAKAGFSYKDIGVCEASLCLSGISEEKIVNGIKESFIVQKGFDVRQDSFKVREIYKLYQAGFPFGIVLNRMDQKVFFVYSISEVKEKMKECEKQKTVLDKEQEKRVAKLEAKREAVEKLIEELRLIEDDINYAGNDIMNLHYSFVVLKEMVDKN